MKNIFLILLLTLSAFGFAQDNYIVKTEDGRRVLLKADFTWEYIDLVKKEASTNVVKTAPKQENTTTTPVAIKKPMVKKTANCGISNAFVEPELNNRIQNQLKKGKATIKHIKKKVAKDNNCSVDEVLLLSASETKERGKYEFCANGTNVNYKRMGNAIIKALKVF